MTTYTNHMLAHQCDLAMEVETEALVAKRENAEMKVAIRDYLLQNIEYDADSYRSSRQRLAGFVEGMGK